MAASHLGEPDSIRDTSAAYGLYVDCDVVCLRPMQATQGPFMAWESYRLSQRPYSSPRDCPILHDLSQITDGWVPPWESSTNRRRLSEYGWGVTGPRALTYFARKHALHTEALPRESFYPLHHRRLATTCNRRAIFGRLDNPYHPLHSPMARVSSALGRADPYGLPMGPSWRVSQHLLSDAWPKIAFSSLAVQIVAVLAVRNEAAYLRNALRHLTRNGLSSWSLTTTPKMRAPPSRNGANARVADGLGSCPFRRGLRLDAPAACENDDHWQP